MRLSKENEMELNSDISYALDEVNTRFFKRCFYVNFKIFGFGPVGIIRYWMISLRPVDGLTRSTSEGF